MGGFGLYIATAFALIFVIEGLIYALFPDSVRRMMALALTLPPARLRLFGFAMILSGFCFTLLLRSFSGR